MDALLHAYDSIRKRSLRLAEPLSAEDCCAQSMPDASPIKWHLAHTTWFFETFVLEPHEPGFAPYDPSFRYLFNSYYNGIGARHPRPQRGLLTRPPLEQVLAWRHEVDDRLARLLAARRSDAELAALITLGLQHEQQHQELMLTDVKHLLAQHPCGPAYLDSPLPAASPPPALAFRRFDGGLVDIGFDGSGFCFDNELPRHREFVAPFELATRLVTNGEYLRFVEEGGYRDPALWLSEGWDRVLAGELAHPLYWRRADDGSWREFTLHGLAPLELARPVTHISLYEADAYARWCGARLPTEAEWEHAARAGSADLPPAPGGDAANRVGGKAAHLTDSAAGQGGGLHPAAATGHGLCQLYGACWQWTSSSYAPYPGFAPAAGAIGEYNGKFMVNQYVLRGSSCATPPGHARASYRNFFPASARWQFTGIRLAR